MSADDYLNSILIREAVDVSGTSPLWGIQAVLQPSITKWGGNFLRGVYPSGSFAKGTANITGTDIDLFISVHNNCPDTLEQIYTSLFRRMNDDGYGPRVQNVSINVSIAGFRVDLVPAKHQGGNSEYHSLYRRRANTWTQTNVASHIKTIAGSGRTSEIRVIKLWRDQKKIDFPSFYLELTVLNALSGARGTISSNVWKVFEYLRDSFSAARVVDPSNTNNVISDDLSATEKSSVVAAAKLALQATQWSQIVV